MNSQIYKAHLRCPCGKSSDAYSLREDGSGFCFSCNKNFKGENVVENVSLLEQSGNSLSFIPQRGLTERVVTKYGISTESYNGEYKSIHFPYSGWEKVRTLDRKSFFTKGVATPGLFGKEAFPDPSDVLIITEGELDAASCFQMLGIHSVSVRSSTSAVNDIKADYKWVSKYQQIYLCFDSDEHGRNALAQCAPIFDFKKLFVLDLIKYKDANEYLMNGDIEAFRTAFRKARKFVPEGVASSFEDISSILEGASRTPICKMPFAELEKVLQGIATKESILLSGLEGIGKTEVLRSIEYELLKSTDFNIGIVHLEESQKATINRLLSYEMKTPLYKSDVIVDKKEKLDAYRKLVRRDNRVFYYSYFGEHDPDTLLSIFRYLVTICDCKVILFDHINLVVSSMDQSSDERRVLDYLCTKTASLVQELDFNFVHICHSNDDGRTRGSRNISQAAHVHVRLERQIDSPDPIERNRIHFTVLKNRPTALSGPAGYAWYNNDTGVLVDPSVVPDIEYLSKME